MTLGVTRNSNQYSLTDNDGDEPSEEVASEDRRESSDKVIPMLSCYVNNTSFSLLSLSTCHLRHLITREMSDEATNSHKLKNNK